MGRLDYETKEGYAVLYFIDSFKYPQDENLIIYKYEEVSRLGYQKLILDFSKTKRLISHGLRGILEIVDGSKRRGQEIKIVVHTPSDVNDDILLLGVDISEYTSDNMDEALGALGIHSESMPRR